MREHDIPRATIEAVTYGNALAAYGQSGQMSAADWAGGVEIDQTRRFKGSGVLRGGQAPRRDENVIE